MTINPNRSVTALTPLLFAPAAGAISALAAKYGLDIDGDALAGIFATGAVIALGKSSMWMKGWQEYEKREAAVREEIDEPVGEGLEAPVDEGLDVVDDVDEDVLPDDMPAGDEDIGEELAALMSEPQE